MSPFRSVGARLSLALVAVVAIALGIVYLIVVPSLERSLREAKLEQLNRTAEALAARFPSFVLDPTYALDLADYMDAAADTANARAVLFQPLDLQEGSLTLIADSRQSGSAGDIANDAIALRAALGLTGAQGVVERNGKSYAEVAVPLQDELSGIVLLLSTPLDETLASVRLVQRRMLLAGAVALLVAMLLGYAAASVFARRLRRLERAADRIAGGYLDEPVVDLGGDEVGQLARAFERMRRRLVQLDHARREFIANASHELRTPLFSLGGFLELLTNEELDEATRRDFLVSMQEQVERLTKLATDLLDLSRLDAGRLHVERDALDLGQLAEAVAEEFTAVARATDHTLEVIVDDAPEALADELRVLQIGRVLVENALRHTPAGTRVRIRVSAEGGSPALTVEDGGPGIESEHVPHVFERFYRVEGGRASGSGLGLAIARELAELMDGSLTLVPGPPTAFRLRLPAADALAGRRRVLAPAGQTD
jgi:signal transduction histidine kinase